MKNIIIGKKSKARAFGKSCIGCQDTQSDIMLSFGPTLHVLSGSNKVTETVENTIVDVFLTKEQAVELIEELTFRLKLNEEETNKKT